MSLPLSPLSRISSMKVHWLWEPYLPRGKLAILDGDPGVGKSLLTVDIAARLSRAAPLPNGVVPDHPHVTLLLGAEDAAADTTRPRAEAAGADLDRLLVMETSDGAPLFFPARLPELEEAIRAHGADLVVIDPIMAFLPPEIAATLDQCVRLGLSPMAALAARTDCAILLVRHLRKTESKRAVHRGLGSIGIIASARTGLVAGPNPADPSQNILAVTKVNPGVVAPSLGYRIQSDADGRAVVAWTGRAELSADTMNRSPAPLQMCDQAAVWLSAQLAAGPRTATELYAAAAAACIPERTLERAKSQLRIGSRKVRLKDRSVWYWFDWGAEWPKNAPFKKPDPLELPSIEDFIT